MDSKELFKRSVLLADSCVRRVQKAQLDNETPCTEWNLRELLNHMVYELSWVPDLLAGKTIAEVGEKYEGDLLEKNPITAWENVRQKAAKAVADADLQEIIHLSYGDFPAEHYIRENGADMLIHGWDVGQAIGCLMSFDEDVARAVYDFVVPRAKEFAASGLFGVPIFVDDADTQTRLLAFYGREV